MSSQYHVQFQTYPAPAGFEIVNCLFPEVGLTPGPKERPAIIAGIGFSVNDPTIPAVRVIFGTSKKCKPSQCNDWDLLLVKDGSAAFEATGLSYTTKFMLDRVLTLPYTSQYFRPLKDQRYGNTPKIGSLQIAHTAALAAARDALRYKTNA